MSVLPQVDSYWEQRAKSAEARLSSELKRCGTAEGGLAETSRQLDEAKALITRLTKQRDDARGSLSDLRDWVDSLTKAKSLAEVVMRIANQPWNRLVDTDDRCGATGSEEARR